MKMSIELTQYKISINYKYLKKPLKKKSVKASLNTVMKKILLKLSTLLIH